LPLVPGACVATGDGAAEEPADDARNARKEPENPKDLCGVATSNLDRAEAAILAAPRGRPNEVKVSAWDHRAAPARLDGVARRFALSAAEKAALEKNGFVVPARLDFPSYAAAFHEVYQSELPVYVSVDSILYAVFRGNDRIVEQLEERRLAPLL